MSEFDDTNEGTGLDGLPQDVTTAEEPPAEALEGVPVPETPGWRILSGDSPAEENPTIESLPEVDEAPVSKFGPATMEEYERESQEPAAEGVAGIGRNVMDAAAAGAASIRDGFEALKDVRRASREHSNARSHLAQIEEELAESRSELEHRVHVETNYDAIVAEQSAIIAEATDERNEAQARIDVLSEEKADLGRQLEQMRQQHEQELRPYKDLVDSSRSRADDANRSLSEARRAARSAENQVNDLTSRRDSRLSTANKAVDNAQLRLSELRTHLNELQADPATRPEAIEEVNATILAESAHLRAAEEEVAEVTAEMKRTVENAQAHLWTQRQSLESAERANESARAEAARRREEYDRMLRDAETSEAVLDNAMVERDMGIRDVTKTLDAATKRMTDAQAILDDANEINSTPHLTQQLREIIASDEAALEVQQRQVESLAEAEREVRERTRGQRIVFYVAVAAAALVVILILWLIFSRPAEPVPEEMGSSAKAIMMGMELLL